MKLSASLVSIVLGMVMLVSSPNRASAIGGGAPDGAGHPNVGVIGFDLDGPDGALPPFALCTAFVVSDSVLVTAAHCIAVAPSASWAVILESGSPDVPVVVPGVFPDDFPFPVIAPVTYASKAVMHPRFGDGRTQTNDVAVLVFPQGTFAHVVPVALPPERELDILAARGGLVGESFTLVGYGTVPLGRTTEQALVKGFRQVATAPFQGLTPETLVLQMTPEATGEGLACSGDSGGPQFVDGSNLAVSLVGGPTNDSPCGTGASHLQRLDTPIIRDFLERFITLPRAY